MGFAYRPVPCWTGPLGLRTQRAWPPPLHFSPHHQSSRAPRRRRCRAVLPSSCPTELPRLSEAQAAAPVPGTTLSEDGRSGRVARQLSSRGLV
eukprot:scaffold6786_cov384-Prasinococcus_capsulatus_cf.AAC.10